MNANDKSLTEDQKALAAENYDLVVSLANKYAAIARSMASGVSHNDLLSDGHEVLVRLARWYDGRAPFRAVAVTAIKKQMWWRVGRGCAGFAREATLSARFETEWQLPPCRERGRPARGGQAWRAFCLELSEADRLLVIARFALGWSLPQMARRLGYNSHCTVLRHVRGALSRNAGAVARLHRAVDDR